MCDRIYDIVMSDQSEDLKRLSLSIIEKMIGERSATLPPVIPIAPDPVDVPVIISEDPLDSSAPVETAVPVMLTATPLSIEMRKAALLPYLLQLKDSVTPAFNDCFVDLCKALIDDKKILNWLLIINNSKCDIFNKARVFRIARIFIQEEVIAVGSELQLNQILEHTDKDTSFRSNMGKESKTFQKIFERIVEIIDRFSCFA